MKKKTEKTPPKKTPEKTPEKKTTHGRPIMIGNTLRNWNGTTGPEKTFKSYTHKDTGISSYRRKITFHSTRNEPLPTMTHGLSTEETTDLLREWGYGDYPHGFSGPKGIISSLDNLTLLQD